MPIRSEDAESARAHYGAGQLGDFTSVDRRLFIIAILGVGVGVVSAFVAVILLAAIGFFTNLFYYGRVSFSFASPMGNQLGDLAIAVPVIGGLIIGAMARYGSERIRGHGIPEALEAILINRSRIDPKVMVLKPLSAAISIGSGGPFGAEGPIIMTGGAFGSVFSQFFKLSSGERKTLLVAGAAGGMAATFNSPVSAVLLAVELLLFEWKPRSLIPVAAAAATATIFRGLLLGTAPLFLIPETQVPNVGIDLSAVPVGLIAGLAATGLTYAVYSSEDLFRKLPIHWMWWPAMGGLIIGVGGIIAPRALGVGYNTIDTLLANGLVVDVIIVLVIVKATIWALSLGSGTSGGVLAPLLIIGGCLGALEAHILPSGTVPLWTLVGMGAILGGTMRAPFTGVVFSLELTHDVNALLPLLIAVATSEAVTIFTMQRSILTEKVSRRGVHVAREYSVDILELTPVRSVMQKNLPTVTADTRLYALVESHSVTGIPGFPVVDALGAMQGYLTREDVSSVIQTGVDLNLAVRDIMDRNPSVVFADEPLRVAAEKMARSGSASLPVVEEEDPQKAVGVVSRSDLFGARLLWFEDEKNREKVLSLPHPPVRKIVRDGFRRLRTRVAGRQVARAHGRDE